MVKTKERGFSKNLDPIETKNVTAYIFVETQAVTLSCAF